MPATILPWAGVDSNYNDGTVAHESQDEITKLRLENHALQLLLREHLNRSEYVQAEDGDEVSSTRRVRPTERNIVPPALVVQNQTKAQSEGRIAEKNKAVHIATPDVPVVPQR